MPATKKTVYTELARIQKELKAPKNQYNSFGKYKYRSCEDILNGLKDVLGDCSIVLGDEVTSVGDRIYIKATAELSLEEVSIKNTAFAREPIEKKGMDASQITGTASSYARKYALNGLFAIDDSKDSDTGIHEDVKPPVGSKSTSEHPMSPPRTPSKPNASVAKSNYTRIMGYVDPISKELEMPTEDYVKTFIEPWIQEKFGTSFVNQLDEPQMKELGVYLKTKPHRDF